MKGKRTLFLTAFFLLLIHAVVLAAGGRTPAPGGTGGEPVFRPGEFCWEDQSGGCRRPDYGAESRGATSSV